MFASLFQHATALHQWGSDTNGGSQLWMYVPCSDKGNYATGIVWILSLLNCVTVSSLMAVGRKEKKKTTIFTHTHTYTYTHTHTHTHRADSNNCSSSVGSFGTTVDHIVTYSKHSEEAEMTLLWPCHKGHHSPVTPVTTEWKNSSERPWVRTQAKKLAILMKSLAIVIISPFTHQSWTFCCFCHEHASVQMILKHSQYRKSICCFY